MTMKDDLKDPENEEVEIEEALYVQLVKMRNRGSSKNRLVEYLIAKKFDKDSAEFIAQDIDEDYKNYKYEEGLKNRKYAITTILVGGFLSLLGIVILNKIYLLGIAIIIAIAGYFYNKYLIAKKVYGEKRN